MAPTARLGVRNGRERGLEATSTRMDIKGEKRDLKLHDRPGRSQARGIIYGTTTLRASRKGPRERERERERLWVCVNDRPARRRLMTGS